MMVNYPFFSFSPFRRYPYYTSPPLSPEASSMRRNSAPKFENFGKNLTSTFPYANKTTQKVIPKKTSYLAKNKSKTIEKSQRYHHTSENSSNEEAMFHLFGLKLYSDDILLICLIFFLYQEGVQDQYLFISLILLLLS